ncbi:carbohydrate ABC transporter permease [Salinispira pacifica]|nr:sugar ABC transporter permease [Salinispira pacifica]
MTFRQKRVMAAWSFLAPFLIIQGIFFVYAAVRAVYFSFTDYNMFNEAAFVGLQNYADLFREANFLYALRNTVAFSLIVTTVQTILALILASILNRKMKGIGFFRAAFYLPSIASSVVITVIFLWLFQRRGFINYIAGTILSLGPSLFTLAFFFFIIQSLTVLIERKKGFPIRFFDAPTGVLSFFLASGIAVLGTMTGIIDPGPSVDIDFVWLQTRQTVLGVPVPLIAIMIQNTFTTIPTLMLIFLAGLQDVPVSYYEAASIDGAGPVRQFFSITVPAIRPVLFLVTTMGLIGTLQMFDQVAIFGDAVPQESVITLAYFVYDRMFPGAQLPEVGLASAAAMFLALFTLTAVLIQRIVIKDRGDV